MSQIRFCISFKVSFFISFFSFEFNLFNLFCNCFLLLLQYNIIALSLGYFSSKIFINFIASKNFFSHI